MTVAVPEAELTTISAADTNYLVLNVFDIGRLTAVFPSNV